MKTVVVFESKYGATRQYAHWIAEALGCDLFEKKHIKPQQLQAYDTIVYGGGLYAGSVSGIDLLTKNFGALAGKNLVLFTCGLADPADNANVEHIHNTLAKLMTPDMLARVQVFHLRGGIDYSRLSFLHKIMMGMLHKALLRKDRSTLRQEDREMLDSYGQRVDFVDKDAILPMLEYMQGLEA